MQSPKILARQAARLCLADRCNERAFDDCFEMGNGKQVIREFRRIVMGSDNVRVAVVRNRRYIPDEVFREAKRIIEESEPPCRRCGGPNPIYELDGDQVCYGCFAAEQPEIPVIDPKRVADIAFQREYIRVAEKTKALTKEAINMLEHVAKLEATYGKQCLDSAGKRAIKRLRAFVEAVGDLD